MRIVTVAVAAFLATNVAAFAPPSSRQRRTISLFSSPVPAIISDEPAGTTVGDTKGAVLRLTEVAISRGDTAILKGVEWSVQANERWGIVGTLYLYS
jgi:ABC-type molybdenum transport system ATPase subunit/photorepair protein PhrA